MSARLLPLSVVRRQLRAAEHARRKALWRDALDRYGSAYRWDAINRVRQMVTLTRAADARRAGRLDDARWHVGHSREARFRQPAITNRSPMALREAWVARDASVFVCFGRAA